MLLSAAMITTSFTAGAQQVYENVDKQGAVEFSDHSSPGAKTIEVKPNIISVTPVKPIEPSTPVSAGEAPSTREGIEPEVEHQGIIGAYDDDRERRRRALNEARDGNEHLVRPAGEAHVPARKGAAHRGGHHR
jgi:hypothetical protein